MIDILLLVGKTCSGKTTIEQELIKKGMKSVVSYTTRPKREGEIEGINYHYISEKEFLEKELEGFFAETTSYNVASHETWYYGSAMEDLTDNKVMIINPEGLREIKEMTTINPIAFYIMANDKTILERLIERGDNLKETKRRIKADKNDFENIDNYVDFSFRNDLGLKPEAIAEMILYTYRKVRGEEK